MAKTNTNNATSNGVNNVTKRPATWPLAIVAALFIIIPFMFWYQTWFGRELKDNEVEQYLKDVNAPRKTQHALTQIAQRMGRGDKNVKRWYPQITALLQHPLPQIRTTAAWVMGQDNSVNEFHEALKHLLNDTNPMVRRNAALSLIRFGDDSGHAELIAMLRPHIIHAEQAGKISDIVHREQSSLGTDAILARITEDNGSVVEVRTPLPGYLTAIMVREGNNVTVGDELVRLAPDTSQLWEALRGLYLIGRSEDLPDIQPYTSKTLGTNAQIEHQARLTIDAIRSRETEP